MIGNWQIHLEWKMVWRSEERSTPSPSSLTLPSPPTNIQVRMSRNQFCQPRWEQSSMDSLWGWGNLREFNTSWNQHLQMEDKNLTFLTLYLFSAPFSWFAQVIAAIKGTNCRQRKSSFKTVIVFVFTIESDSSQGWARVNHLSHLKKNLQFTWCFQGCWYLVFSR